MGKPTTTWKSAERKIAEILGGQRRGADFRNLRGGGKSDIILPGFSVEVKHGKRMGWSLLTGALAQAETNREFPDDVPVAILHPERTPYENSYVILRLSDFTKMLQESPKFKELK